MNCGNGLQHHDVTRLDCQQTLRCLHHHDTKVLHAPANYWRAGAHADFDTLTLLFQRPGKTQKLIPAMTLLLTQFEATSFSCWMNKWCSIFDCHAHTLSFRMQQNLCCDADAECSNLMMLAQLLQTCIKCLHSMPCTRTARICSL